MEDDKSALESFQNDLEIKLEQFGEDHPDTGESYISIRVAQHEMKNYWPALDSLQHALQIRLKLFGDHLTTAESYYNIGLTQRVSKSKVYRVLFPLKCL